MLGNTPMMRQYQQIKKHYPDTILFFRLGDFYEMFGADAELASRELEIVLTGRDAGMESRIPMCGVPYHAADGYIARLIAKGYKVAICEQTEDPKASKGIVKREVIRVITPGTNLDAPSANSAANTYLVALNVKQQVWGMSFCDITTGEFKLTEFAGSDGINALFDELYRLHPLEILVPDDLEDKHCFMQEGSLLTSLGQDYFSYPEARRRLREHFQNSGAGSVNNENQINNDSGRNEKDPAANDSPAKNEGMAYPEQARQAVASAGAILRYLTETQKAPPQQIKELRYYNPNSFMMIDATTFRNLEIITSLRTNEKKGSLYDLLDRTKTAPGSRLLRNWLERPLNNRGLLEERYSALAQLSASWSERQTMRKLLAEVYDLERIMTRILYKRANPRELLALKSSLSVLPQLKALTGSMRSAGYLARLFAEFDALEDVSALLSAALLDDPPHNLKDGGVIKAGYHTTIDTLRETSKHGKEWIAQLESAEKAKTGIKSLKIGFNKVFGYYLEVTKSNYALVPEYFQRKQTLANAERYITDELLRLENEVLGAEEKLVALEEEVYLGLLDLLGGFSPRIRQTTQLLAQLDVLQALADVAVLNSYARPILLDSDVNSISLSDLRHPVVEQMPDLSAFVPNDLMMDEKSRLQIITGPNMGGKSTFCRSVALAVIMAQAGSFVPAKKAIISLRDRVFARVGASDDLRSGQSTFMVEMNEVSNILRYATPQSLVILDEVGRGTSTYDGISVAWAVSEYLVNTLHTKTLFATHYHELTQLAKLNASIKNLSLAVKEAGEEIIFLHKIIDGPADRSYGIHVGRLAGLPNRVIRRADEILKALERDGLNGKGSPNDQDKSNDKDSKIADFPADIPCPDHMEYDSIYKTAGLSEELRECLESVIGLDTTMITPLEAMNNLYALQQRLKHLKLQQDEEELRCR